MKLVVYTCITGGYDKLKPYSKDQEKDTEFICFTDNISMPANGWMLKPIPDDLINLPKAKIQRTIKICPHRYLKDYDVSLWVDGNIQITKNVSKMMDTYDLNKFHFYTRKHPVRTCIYEEAKAVVRYRRDKKVNITPQIEAYKKEGMPANLGLVESGIILRKHNEKDCILLDNLWAQQILKYSHRDQLSFNYCLWKLHQKIGFLNIPKLVNNSGFQWIRHGK